jgi:hypothetical protein
MTTTAYATQKKWVPVTCDACNTKYSCLLEAAGSSSDSFLPSSEEDLKDHARYKLGLAFEKKASAIPCPGCGNFSEDYVERVQNMVRRCVVWGLGIVLFVVLSALVAAVAPKAPLWIVLVILAVSIVAPRFVSGRIAQKFDPNLDLQKNLRLVRAKVAKGLVRVESPNPPASG